MRFLLTYFQDYDGGSPLITAAYSLDYELVEYLIAANANVLHCDMRGVNALLAATLGIAKRFGEAKAYNHQQGVSKKHKKKVRESGTKIISRFFIF